MMWTQSNTEGSNGKTLMRGVAAPFGLVLALLPLWGAHSAPLDSTPRTAVISAYKPEWLTLQKSLEDRREHIVGGTVFLTGTISGKPVVLFLSGISMVNAAMTTQSVLDHFVIQRLVFSGIAGGVDP